MISCIFDPFLYIDWQKNVGGRVKKSLTIKKGMMSRVFSCVPLGPCCHSLPKAYGCALVIGFLCAPILHRTTTGPQLFFYLFFRHRIRWQSRWTWHWERFLLRPTRQVCEQWCSIGMSLIVTGCLEAGTYLYIARLWRYLVLPPRGNIRGFKLSGRESSSLTNVESAFQAVVSISSSHRAYRIVPIMSGQNLCKCLKVAKKLIVCIDGTSNQFSLQVSPLGFFNNQ